MTETIASPQDVQSSDPSLVAVNMPTDPLDKMREVMADVLPMFDLDDEDFAAAVPDFVNHRINELGADAEKKEVGYQGTDRFISATTPMVLSGGIIGGREFYLDDPDAYIKSFAWVRAFYKKLANKMPPEKAYLHAAIKGSNLGQIQYFESYEGDHNKRLNTTADIISEDDLADVSIRDFKGFAACVERAGVTHNTLKILGVDSVLESGNLKTMYDDGRETDELHLFITFGNSRGERVVYDPTNPSVTRDLQAGKTTFQATFTPVGEDQHSASAIVNRVKIDETGQETVMRATLEYNF